MNRPSPSPRLVMVREDLEDFPRFALPPGYSFRWYHPGDEAEWVAIHLAADLFNPISPELFTREFGLDEALLARRQVYLRDSAGRPIGTGTAWFNDNFQGQRYGRVHWLAILPEFQGRGLAKPLLSVICERLRDLGHDRAYLTTAAARVPAINLYRQFGFVPLVQNEGF